MLVIRLFRVGKKNQPSFKIVVTDKRKPPRAGRFVEEVGFWNPLTKEKVLRGERIKYWLSVGAKPSATVHNLLVSEKMFAELRSSYPSAKASVLEGKKIPVHKKAKKSEEKPTEPATPAPEEKPTPETLKTEKAEEATPSLVNN